MADKFKLDAISDDDLVRRLSEILKRSRRIEAELVAHIGEVDRRRLYARQASPSMFVYCTERLHLSEAETYLRIAAARAARKHPALLPMLEDGRLHLSGIAKLAPVLTQANCEALLARAAHKTKRKIEELVAEVAPKPDVPPTMRKLPARREPSKPAAVVELRPDAVEAPTQPAPTPRPAPGKPAVVEPLAPSRYRVQFTASAELHEKLERLSSLMPGVDLASLVEAAVTEKLERLEAKRFGQTNKPRKSLEEVDTSPGSRYISAPVKRIVWKRDGGRCTDLSPNGRRCTAREGLEYHHDDPYGLGGDRSPDNVRLLCEVHNALMAERDFGKDVIDQYRRSDDRVSEPPPVLRSHPVAVAIHWSSYDLRIDYEREPVPSLAPAESRCRVFLVGMTERITTGCCTVLRFQEERVACHHRFREWTHTWRIPSCGRMRTMD